MLNYQSVAEQIKKKIDMRMERSDPSSLEYESAFITDGRYTSVKQHMIEDMSGWTRSFLTGAVAHMYSYFKEEKYLKYLEDSMGPYQTFMKKSVELCNMPHDSGFLYSLYSAALYEVSGNKEAYELNYKVADEFAKRFRYKAGIIQGFGWARDPEVQIIIDDMMNLSLLMWAHRNNGHPYYEEILRSHIGVITKVMFRDDYTTRHAYVFDSVTGEPLGERNVCGYGPGSAWSRGNAWAVYGLVSAMKALGECPEYSVPLNGLLNTYISYLPENGIPQWDFMCRGAKEEQMVDTSAAAILAAAILKLNDFYDLSKLQGEAKNAVKYADLILESLVKEYWADDENENIIEGGQCGWRNIGCVWGDYFFTECIMRKIRGKDTPDFLY